ncbi:MAG: DUF362 domain-containing protein [Kiritimatiellae bacterium]|nr:DUF362 domain-containing protein [Kiritimatiellia bacterium]
MKSKVFFTSMRTRALGDGLCGKLSRVMDKAGFAGIDFNRKFAAIKIHFGERGNLAFLRPNFARTVVDKVKALGGKPFLTDCNTLYVGSRKDAIEHIETAWLNGFLPYNVDCPVIIGDGLKGTDEVAVPIEGGIVLKEALIGRAVMDADIIITLNHFKGHEMCGMGGAIKNLGMGCGSRAGKMAQHCDGKVSVEADKCVGCGKCARICAHGAPSIVNRKCVIDENKCLGCGRCIGVCPADAISPSNWNAPDLLDCKMAEYAKAVIQNRPNFHIDIAMDISPNCDCHSENDAPIVPDVGIFASFDPVACDQAAADAVNAADPNRDSALGDRGDCGRDHLSSVCEGTDWTRQLVHAEKVGAGTRDYELVTVG